MKLDWQQIEKIYHSALEHEPRQRKLSYRMLVVGMKLYAGRSNRCSLTRTKLRAS